MDGASAVNTPRQHVRPQQAVRNTPPKKQPGHPNSGTRATRNKTNALRPTSSAQRGTYMLCGCRVQEASTWRIVVDREPLSDQMEEGPFGR